MATLFCAECGEINDAAAQVCKKCREPLLHPEDLADEEMDEGEVVEEIARFLSKLKFFTDEELEMVQYAVAEVLAEREVGSAGSDDDDDLSSDEGLELNLVFNGAKKKDVPIDLLCGIMTIDALTEGFGFSEEMLRFISITGLRAENGVELLFKSSSLFPFPHLDEDRVKQIKSGMTFEVMYTDLREDNVKKLTPVEKARLTNEFKAIDSDCNGSLSADEIRDYFKMKAISKSPRGASHMKRMQSFQKRDGKSAAQLNLSFMKAEDRAGKQLETEIQRMLDLNVSGTGEISLQEYIAGRAGSVLAARKK